MAQQKGANIELLLGYETTFKTAPAAGFVLPVNTFGLRGTQALNAAQTLVGNRNPVMPFVGYRTANGSIVIPVDSAAMWYWLKAMFGDPTSTGTGPYEHEFKIGATMPSITLEAAFTDLATDKYQRFTGCKIESWEMAVGGDGELVSTVAVVGSVDSIEASPFDAAPTSVSLARLNNFEAAITEGGSALANATEMSLAINFGLDTEQYVIGASGVRGSLPEGIVAVGGNIKTLFEDTTLLDKAINGTESSLKITITGSSSSILEVEIQELRYERNSPDVPGPQGLLVDLNFQGYYEDGSEASAIVARLTNNDEHA